MNVFYSGTEGAQHFQACIDAGCKRLLISYLYLEKSDLSLIKKRKKKYPELEYMIDSGAHSIQSDKQKYASWSLQDFENYLKRYVAWIRANRQVIDSCVELDIDWNVGINVVEGWQKKYFLPLLEEGINVIFVWHKQRGLEAFEDMCSRFPYVGLPGEFSSEKDFNKYVTVAKRYTTKLHGFAANKQSDLRDYPWFSGDATTWKSSERYGTLIHWDEQDQRLYFEEDKSKRWQYRKSFEKHGLDADAIIADTNYREVTKYALISMRLMEEFYVRKYADRTFYYSLRLPHPNACVALTETEVSKAWELLRPDTLWPNHLAEKRLSMLRRYLAAIAAVQYRDYPFLDSNKTATDFLAAYFPKFIGPPLADPQVFQKELAQYISPPNPPALERVDAIHWIAENNPPKEREEKSFTPEELEWTLPVSLLGFEV